MQIKIIRYKGSFLIRQLDKNEFFMIRDTNSIKWVMTEDNAYKFSTIAELEQAAKHNEYEIIWSKITVNVKPSEKGFVLQTLGGNFYKKGEDKRRKPELCINEREAKWFKTEEKARVHAYHAFMRVKGD